MKYIIIAISVLCVVCFFSIKSNIEKSKELKDLKKQEKKNAKIDKETQDKIENITTGNIQHDVHAGSNILHDLANKRR